MKLGKIVLIVATCALLLMGVAGASLMPSSSMAQAGPLLSPLPTVAPPSGTCVARATVNIRRGPSVRYRIVGRLPRGGKFTKSRVQGSWIYGTSRYGTGWVLKTLVKCS